MGASKAADYVIIIQDVGVCDICGACGFEELLAVCIQCNERAEHVYCMQTLCDAVPPNWVCEGCKRSIVLESDEVQSERDSCANTMADDFNENENIKTMFSQRKASAETSWRHQKQDNNGQGSEEFELETTMEAEHLSDGVSKKLSCLILSAEDELSECSSDESAPTSQTNCSSPATAHHQSDLERVCHSLKVDGVKTTSNPQLNDSSAVDATEFFTKPPVTSGAPEHPFSTSSCSLSPTSCSPHSGFCLPLPGLPLRAWNSPPDSIEVIDMEIDVICEKDVDSGNVNGNAQEPRTQNGLGLPSPNQPDLSRTLLEPPSFTDLWLPPLPRGSPPVQPSLPATPLESGTQEESPLPALPPDSPPMQPSPPKTPSDIVNSTCSPPPGLPSAQPSSPRSPCNQFYLDDDSSRPPTTHQDHALKSNLDSSSVLKHTSPGQEGDCSMNANLESLASRLDKKRPRPASRTENIVAYMSRKAPRYGFQSDILEILIDAAETSRSKRQAPSKKQDLEHESHRQAPSKKQDLEHESHRQSNDSADGHTPVKDDKKNASSVVQLCEDSLKNPENNLLDKASFVASKIISKSALKSNEEPHVLSSDRSTRSCSDLPRPSIVEQAIPKHGKDYNRLVPLVSLEDGHVAQPSSMNTEAASASSSSILNGVCAKQDVAADIIRPCKQGVAGDIVRPCMDGDLISKVGGDCNLDDVRTCENARDNMGVRQVSCLALFPALESSSAFDRTGILVDLLSEHELLSDLSWQVMPLVQQLEEPWYKPLPNLNDPPFLSSLDKSLMSLPDEDIALTLRLPRYRKHGNIWIPIESDTRTCYDENVKLALSCCTI